jgi:hypothetical protein
MLTNSPFWKIFGEYTNRGQNRLVHVFEKHDSLNTYAGELAGHSYALGHTAVQEPYHPQQWSGSTAKEEDKPSKVTSSSTRYAWARG